MIHMPRRSVTRFFIPLIDVLLLLFCIFLLMPLVDEPGAAASPQNKTDDEATRLRAEWAKLRQEQAKIAQFQKLQAETAQLRVELDHLRKQKAKLLEQRLIVHVLDIDGKSGALSIIDLGRQLPITNQQEAAALIARHLREARGGEVYYHFRHPGPLEPYPTQEQEKQWRRWFGQVANSLIKEKPRE